MLRRFSSINMLSSSLYVCPVTSTFTLWWRMCRRSRWLTLSPPAPIIKAQPWTYDSTVLDCVVSISPQSTTDVPTSSPSQESSLVMWAWSKLLPGGTTKLRRYSIKIMSLRVEHRNLSPGVRPEEQDVGSLNRKWFLTKLDSKENNFRLIVIWGKVAWLVLWS